MNKLIVFITLILSAHSGFSQEKRETITQYSMIDSIKTPTDKGEIIYTLDYYDTTALKIDKWVEKLLPEKMIVKFKDSIFYFQVSFGLGMIKQETIIDLKDSSCIRMLKFMRNRNYCVGRYNIEDFNIDNIILNDVLLSEKLPFSMPYEITTCFADVPVKIIAKKISINQFKIPMKYNKVTIQEYLRMINEVNNI